MCTTSKRAPGAWNGAWVCRVTLDRWQCEQVLAHRFISWLIHGQTKRVVIRCCVACTLGLERELSTSTMRLRRLSGAKGLICHRRGWVRWHRVCREWFGEWMLVGLLTRFAARNQPWQQNQWQAMSVHLIQFVIVHRQQVSSPRIWWRSAVNEM